MNFFELAAKTNYSFLEGASTPEEMVQEAAQQQYAGIAITDRNGVYGIPRAHFAAKQNQIPLVIGAEISLNADQPLYLLARNRQGYGDLCELLSEYHCHGLQPQDPRNPRRQYKTKKENTHFLSLAAIKNKSKDLLCLFPIQPYANIGLVNQLSQIFDTRLSLLVSRFQDGQEDRITALALFLEKQFHLRCIASNQPLFHQRQRKPLQDVLRCIDNRTTLKTAGNLLLPNAERCLKSKPDIFHLFRDRPDWIENTLQVSETCRFSLDEIQYHYPDEWIPEGECAQSYLEKLVWEGTKERYPEGAPISVSHQIQHELNLIGELNYADYFLTTWDIVRFARSRRILCQGRGSAANSIVCFLLGITAIDPIRLELLFERFLSRERNEPPDIDIDFEHERREEVIQYIYERYGRHRAAITAEIICFRRRSALRELGKVFEISEQTIEAFLHLTHKRSLDEIDEQQWQEASKNTNPKTFRSFAHCFNEILGFPRHLGTHVGGFVLCHDALNRNVPVEKAAMPGRSIIQWDKNDLDALGFVRVDVLGLGILTCIRKAFDSLKDQGISLSLYSVPSEDSAVYDQICAADTVGVFQIESRAQMNMLPRLRPRNFFDLIVEISLVRPGPIQGEMVHPYLRRRAGKEAIHYPHPELETILRKTYGVPLFQEQIMKMAIQVAGFSPGEADQLRRAMGSWRRDGPNKLSAMGEKFRQGLIRKGIEHRFADQIFKQIEGFAEYGFPESHAASFAILAYVTSYLKHYYPDVFVTALLNAQPMGFYSSHSLIHDAMRHGVSFTHIDINFSSWDNQIYKKNHVRLGFREVRSLPWETGLAIENLRSQRPFFSLFDFAQRLKDTLAPKKLTKRELFHLAAADAFRSLKLDRRQALWEIQALPLSDSVLLPHFEEKIALKPEKKWEKIQEDYQATGVCLQAHPMNFFRPDLEAQHEVTSKEIARMQIRRKKVTTSGVVICRQMPPTASGVLFLTLEDEFGFTNLVVWSKTYEKYRDTLLTCSLLRAKGHLQLAEDGDVRHLIVESVEPLLNQPYFEVPSHDWG